MAKILSQSDRINNRLKNFFVPSFAGGILLFLLGTIMLLAYNLSQIINWVGTTYLESADNLNLSINVFSQGLGNSFDAALGGRLGQITVWALIGSLAYIVIWFLKNILNSFENDVIVDRYLHPSTFNRAGYWGSAMAGKVFFGAMVIVLAAYSYLAIKVIMPATTALANTAINDFRLPDSILYIALCIFIPALMLYIWTLAAKIVGHLWKLF